MSKAARRAPKIPFRLMQMGSSSISATMATQPQQGSSHCACRRAPNNRQPSKFPGLLRSRTHEVEITPRLGTSKKPQEHQRLRGPTTADLSGHNNQSNSGQVLSFRLPTVPRHGDATRSLRQACTVMASRSRSRKMTLVVTRAPASRHTLAAALSSAKPRLANTPARAQAARWCHWNRVEGDTGSVNGTATPAEAPCEGRRRNKSVRNTWESKRTRVRAQWTVQHQHHFQAGENGPLTCGESPPNWPRVRLGSCEQRCAVRVHPKPIVCDMRSHMSGGLWPTLANPFLAAYLANLILASPFLANPFWWWCCCWCWCCCCGRCGCCGWFGPSPGPPDAGPSCAGPPALESLQPDRGRTAAGSSLLRTTQQFALFSLPPPYHTFGLSCETPAALGLLGFHATTRELQTCTF